MSGVFDGLWRHGRVMTVLSSDTGARREFWGFLEPLSLSSANDFHRREAGVVLKERFRLISEPSETFPEGRNSVIICGSRVYGVLSIKELYDGDTVSHRESVLVSRGEVSGNG